MHRIHNSQGNNQDATHPSDPSKFIAPSWVPQTTQGLRVVGKILQQVLEDCAMQQ